jgi:polysaccharide pyruvyl transferase WcaK-like protein
MQRYWAERDDEVLRRVESELGGLCVRTAPEWPAPVLKGVLARARAVVACRYHAVVFALTSHTPAVSVAVSPEYEWKLSGVYDQFGRADWLTRAEKLQPALLDVLRRRDVVSAELREKEQELRPRVARFVETLESVLGGRHC